MKSFTTILAVFLCAISAYGETVTISFKTLAWNHFDDAIYYDHAGESISLKATTYLRSTTSYTAEADIPIVVYKKISRGGEIVKQSVGSIMFPKDLKEGLLLIYGQGERFAFFPVVDSIAEFPYGNMKFVNLSPWTLYVLLGDQKVAIEAQKSAVIEPNTAANTNRLMIKMGVNPDADIQLVYSNAIRVHDTVRSVYFVARAPNYPRKTVEIKVLKESAQAGKTK